jgi:hypothetical protein
MYAVFTHASALHHRRRARPLAASELRARSRALASWSRCPVITCGSVRFGSVRFGSARRGAARVFIQCAI